MNEQASIKEWQDLNQTTLAVYKQCVEDQTAAIRRLMAPQGGSANWARLVQSSLHSWKELSESQQTAFNSLWRAQVAAVDLTDVVSSMKELCEICASTATTLVRNQMNGVSAIVEGFAEYLEAVKQTGSWEEVVAAQAHLITEIQQKLKTSSLDSLQTLGSVRSALTTWAERSLEEAASEERKTKKTSQRTATK